MDNPLLSTFRHAGLFMRTVTGTVLLTFTMLVLAPAAMAAQADIKKAKNEALMKPSEEEELSKTVLAIDEQLKRMQSRRVKGKAVQGLKAAPATLQSEKQELKALRQRAEALDASVMANFAAVEKHIRDKKLPPVIMERQKEAVKQYKAEMAAMLANLKGAEGAKDETEFKARLDKSAKHLAGKKLRPKQQPFDPNNLPNHSFEPTKEKPKKSKKEFTQAGLFDTPYPKVAALGDFKFDKLTGASDPAYLAETVEVKLTDAVKAKAAELNHDPVKIYHWVLNNVDWLPTWGSMQDSDHTLSSRRGNAMDIASLTIALLRASGIPARYVHGTIEVPEDKFRNWTGGFENVEAAANFSSSGGIPTTGVVAGGKITKVQLEHIWVEAAIDYQPSRGAVNREADTWVEMDPSYKQYQFLPGLDVAQISGIDGEALAQQFAASGTVNEAEGWVQGLDPTILENAQAQAKTALENHIAQMQDPTVGDVIGGRKVIVKEFPVLPSALVNRVLIKGVRYGAIPAPLQHKVSFALGYDPYAEINGTPSLEITYPLAQVNNRKVTISFRPATAADEAALKSLLPEGEITDVSQLPTSIPAYLVKVVPELRVEGEVVLTGTTPMALGTDFDFRYATDVVSHGRQEYTSVIPAGSYYAVMVAGGSVSPSMLAELRKSLESTKVTLESRETKRIVGLGRDGLLGDMLFAGTLTYAAEYEGLTRGLATRQKAITVAAPSMGLVGYKPKVKYLYSGVPRSLSSGGIEMDLGGLKNYDGVLSGKRNNLIGLRFELGLTSSVLEHAIPEQMFVGGMVDSGEAISAVKALGKAAESGQRIYCISEEADVGGLANTRLDAQTVEEIRTAVSAGKYVITHSDSVSVPGWSGFGYVVFDPISGDGAYKISGGMNGAFFAGFLAGHMLALLLMSIPSLFDATAATGGVLAPFFLEALLGIFVACALLGVFIGVGLTTGTQLQRDCFLLGFLSGLLVVGGIFGAGGMLTAGGVGTVGGLEVGTEGVELVSYALTALGLPGPVLKDMPDLYKCEVL